MFEAPWKFNNIFNTKIPYFSFPDFRDRASEAVPIIKNNSISIIDGSCDPFSLEDIKSFVYYYDIDHLVIILTSNFEETYNFSNVIFCPLQFFRSRHFYRKIPIGKRKYKASCINRNPIGHRLYTYYKLYHHIKFQEMMISFNGLSFPEFGNKGVKEVLTLDHRLFSDIPEDIKEQIKLINLNKPAFDGDDIHCYSTINQNKHPAYTESYLNLITETNAYIACISEKTFKPIVSSQLFLVSGSNKIIKCLRHLGFDTFDDIFVNHNYEDKPSMVERVDALFDIFNSVYEQIEDLYFQNQIRILENQNYMFSENLYNRIISPLAQHELLA